MAYFKVTDASGVVRFCEAASAPPGAVSFDDEAAFRAAITAASAAPPSIDLVGYAAQVRFARETAGISVGGIAIATDLASQARIANAYVYLQATNGGSVEFKAVGGWVTLTADQVKAIALAVGAHVQKCFAVENEIDVGLSASPPTITTTAQIDAAFAATA